MRGHPAPAKSALCEVVVFGPPIRGAFGLIRASPLIHGQHMIGAAPPMTSIFGALSKPIVIMPPDSPSVHNMIIKLHPSQGPSHVTVTFEDIRMQGTMS